MHMRWFVGFSLLALVAPPTAGAWRVELPNGFPNAVAHDPAGDIIAAGSVLGFAVMKLSAADGAEVWRHDVDGTAGGGDAWSVVSDGAGDVIAAGSLDNTTTNDDFVVMKLDGATGAELWRQELDGPVSLFDAANTVVVDGAGDVVAAGSFETNATYPGGYDMAIVKLAGGTGAELWRTTIAGTKATGIEGDSAWQVVTDGAGDVLVAGVLENTGSRTEFAVAKLSGATGAELWRREIDGDTDVVDADIAEAIVVNPAGDVFAAGRVNDEFTVVKLAGATGNQLWRTDIPGRGSGVNDTAQSLVLDASGDVVAAGLLRQDGQSGTVGDFDFLVARLAGSTGTEVWRYETRRPGNDLASDVAMDSAGDVIAVGHFESVPTFWDFTVVKLDGDTGSERWVQRIDGTTGRLDEQVYPGLENARAVTVTPGGTIAVAGVLNNSSGGSFSVLTLAELDGAVGPVRGTKLDVRDFAGDPSRRRLTTVLRDQAITIPPPGSGGDPRTGGATVRLVNPTTLEAADVALPPGPAWRALGTPPGRRGYVYSDPASVNGPCRGLRAKPGFLRAVCAGAIPFSLDEPSQGALAASIRLGTADPQCAVFGGDVSRDAGTGNPGPTGEFKAGAALPATGACP